MKKEVKGDKYKYSSNIDSADNPRMVSKHQSTRRSGGKGSNHGSEELREKGQSSKYSGNNQHDERDQPQRSRRQQQPHGTKNEEDAKKYEVGIVEIASNLSDLSGSTGDVDSNVEDGDDDNKQLSTRGADVKEFEILIQAKHAEACKAMGVRSSFVQSMSVLRMGRTIYVWSDKNLHI